MLRTGTHFSYDAPDGWSEFRDGGQHVYQGPGPGLQELIIQSHVPTGGGSHEERSNLLAQLATNALEGLESALESAPFRVLRPLSPDSSLDVQPAWSVVAVAEEDGTLFCGAVLRGTAAVLLLTFEASSAESLPHFRRVVTSVRHATGGSDVGA